VTATRLDVQRVDHDLSALVSPIARGSGTYLRLRRETLPQYSAGKSGRLAAAAMYLEELVLEGFKSYPQRTVIKGWDSSFTAV
jgi:hypothetical protein